MDWVSISSLATAGGTLALAVATFSSTRSANAATRISELALRQQLRPVLMHSQLEDPEQKIMFHGGHWVRVPGSGAAVEHEEGVVYMSLSLRNVGSGIGVLLGWDVLPDVQSGRQQHIDPDDFRQQMRDLWIPAGGIGLWQGALRDDSDDLHGQMRGVVADPRGFAIDLLYADHLGRQRAISRFSVTPTPESGWIASVVRHWPLD